MIGGAEGLISCILISFILSIGGTILFELLEGCVGGWIVFVLCIWLVADSDLTLSTILAI